MLREYEYTLIVKGEMPDGERAEVFKKYEDLLCQDGGEVMKKDDWGVKKLAYSIKGQYRGHYAIHNLTSKPELVAEAERLMRIDENVLRHMIINISKEIGDVEARKAELHAPPKVRKTEGDRPGGRSEGRSRH